MDIQRDSLPNFESYEAFSSHFDREFDEYLNDPDVQLSTNKIQMADYSGKILALFKQYIEKGGDKTTLLPLTAKAIAIIPSSQQTAESTAPLVAFLDTNGWFNCPDSLKELIFNSIKSNNTPILEKALNAYNKLTNNNGLQEKDDDGYAPLHHACRDGYVEISLKLIELGANIHDKSNYGDTPFHIACWCGRKELALKLFELGVNIHEKGSDDFTALHSACRFGYKELILKLIELGVNIYEKTQAGDTPLHLVCRMGDVEIALKLIELGANIHEKNAESVTPFFAACLGGHFKVIDELLKHDKTVLFLATAEDRNAIDGISPDIKEYVMSTLTAIDKELLGIFTLNSKEDDIQERIDCWQDRDDFDTLIFQAFATPPLVSTLIKHNADRLNNFKIYTLIDKLPPSQKAQFLFLCSPQKQIECLKSLSVEERNAILNKPIYFKTTSISSKSAVRLIIEECMKKGVGSPNEAEIVLKTVLPQLDPAILGIFGEQEPLGFIFISLIPKMSPQQLRVLIPQLTALDWLNVYRADSNSAIRNQIIAFSLPHQLAKLELTDIIHPKYLKIQKRVKEMEQALLKPITSEKTFEFISNKLDMCNVAEAKIRQKQRDFGVEGALKNSFLKEQKESIENAKKQIIDEIESQYKKIESQLDGLRKDFEVVIPVEYLDPVTSGL